MNRCAVCKHFWPLRFNNVCKKQHCFLIPGKDYNDCEHYEPGLESTFEKDFMSMFRGDRHE